MTSKKKSILLYTLLIAIIILVFLVIYIVFYKRESEEKESQIAKELYTEQTVNDFALKIIDIKYEEGFSNVVIEIKNTSFEEKMIGGLVLNFYDNKDRQLAQIYTYNENVITPSSNINISASIDMDITSASSITYDLAYATDEVTDNE